ncbi:galactarate dehydratase [Sporosarcina sp. FSL W8-0480]|uniref:galactarate dehydratase n=2 Tax=Sporosarcina sp. FSL W8-0480 TaxID=2954701 RepID=UPI0030DD67CC
MMTDQGVEVKPISIKMNALDNVTIVGNDNGLPAKTNLQEGIQLIQRTPQGHKVALKDFQEGDAIIRYGEIIGFADREIPKGSWIRETMLRMPEAPKLSELEHGINVEPLEPFKETYTFMGYPNPDGSFGTKNLLGITTSVQCVTGVLGFAVEKIKKDLLPQYPNVDDVVAIDHAYGCGVAIDGLGSEIPIRTIRNLTSHPNFGGEMLIIGLGCEKLTLDRLDAGESESDVLFLQDRNGFSEMVDSIVEMAKERLERLNRRQRVEAPLSKLTVGLQCGGSDALSGVTANPAVGHAADLLVRAGASVMFSEVTEVRDGIHLLTARAETEEVRNALIREMEWYDAYLARGLADRSANTTPGNKKGGLSNIVEKSLGSIVKSGTAPIVDVLAPGEKVRKNGLTFAATPAGDFVCGTLQLASGMHIEVFTTGRGTPYNLSMAPVLKVATRTTLSEQWHDLIDVNAGKIIDGGATIEEIGEEIFKAIIDVASGRRQTWADHWGIKNDLVLFNPAPIT